MVNFSQVGDPHAPKSIACKNITHFNRCRRMGMKCKYDISWEEKNKMGTSGPDQSFFEARLVKGTSMGTRCWYSL